MGGAGGGPGGQVTIDMGGEEVELYCATGSNITIITPDMYQELPPGMGL